MRNLYFTFFFIASQCVQLSFQQCFNTTRIGGSLFAFALAPIKDLSNPLGSQESCYYSCGGQIVTHSANRGDMSRLTLMDKSAPILTDIGFLKTDQVYVLNHLGMPDEEGGNGIGCFQVMPGNKLNHYPKSHQVCSTAQLAVCGFWGEQRIPPQPSRLILSIPPANASSSTQTSSTQTSSTQTSSTQTSSIQTSSTKTSTTQASITQTSTTTKLTTRPRTTRSRQKQRSSSSTKPKPKTTTKPTTKPTAPKTTTKTTTKPTTPRPTTRPVTPKTTTKPVTPRPTTTPATTPAVTTTSTTIPTTTTTSTTSSGLKEESTAVTDTIPETPIATDVATPINMDTDDGFEANNARYQVITSFHTDIAGAHETCQKSAARLSNMTSEKYDQVAVKLKASVASRRKLIIGSWNGDSYNFSQNNCLILQVNYGIYPGNCNEASAVLCES